MIAGLSAAQWGQIVSYLGRNAAYVYWESLTWAERYDIIESGALFSYRSLRAFKSRYYSARKFRSAQTKYLARHGYY